MTDKKVRSLKKSFKRLGAQNGIYLYYEPDELPMSQASAARLVHTCVKNRIDCLIPCLPKATQASGSVFALWRELFEMLLPLAHKRGLKVGLNLESKLESCFFSDDSPIDEDIRTSLMSRILNCREYYCSGGQHVRLELGEYNVMAVTCYEGDNNDSADISDHLSGGVLDYTPADGNYIINTYTCDTEDILKNSFAHTLNKMNYHACKTYVDLVFELLGDTVAKYVGNTLSVLHMTEICFDAPNRRNWDENFNLIFEKMFGTPTKNYYDALFYSIGEVTPHIKEQLMRCRSQMLSNGIFKALSDASNARGLELISGMIEPKLADSVWLNGDTMKNLSVSACARLDKAYMYGTNSIKLASSAAFCYGSREVYCELYGDNYCFTDRTAFKDALHAYAGGCSRLIIHMPQEVSRALIHDPSELRYLDRIPIFSRCRALLRDGATVSDIGILFPSHSMSSEIFLYQSKEDGFEYPDVLDNNDYMAVINILSYYCSQDPVLIHPDVLRSSCSLSGSGIKMNVGDLQNEFKVLILPGISVISVENMKLISEFFDRGGKVIATGRLPRLAAEYHPSQDGGHDDNDFMRLNEYGTAADREVRALVKHVFGSAACNNSSIQEYYRNRNQLGGEAYYICASRTSSDGTLFCNENLLRQILYSFKLPLDVYISNSPSQMGYDALNDTYPNFSRLGFDVKFPGGGMIKHIHKKRDGCEIYFFSNTTDKSYSGYVFLRGMLSPELLITHSGRCRRLQYRYVSFNHCVYTAVKVEIPPSRSVFIVSPTLSRPLKRLQNIPKIFSPDKNFLTE